MITLTGKKVAEGIAVGRLTFYKRGKKEIRRIYVEDAKKEVLRFKKACEKAVQEIKKECPKKSIRLYRVLPSCKYIPHKEEYQYQRSLFDDIFVCDASDGAHYKSMIGKRNRWMVEQSDFMIAYVMHESGGAYSAFQYAGKQNVEIIRVGMNT